VLDSATRYDPFPLTDVQHAYWIGRQAFFPLGKVSCHIYMEFDLGTLDVSRLRRAWQSLIERHDMLRAVVRPDGLQQVLRQVPLYVVQHQDLRDWDRSHRESELDAIRRTMSHQVRPASEWPLFEFRTSRLEISTRIHASVDLLIADFWSIHILFGEWFQLYIDPDARLEPIRLTFRDHVLGIEKRKKRPSYRRALDYWHGRLDSLPPGPALPLAVNPSRIERPRFNRRQTVLEAAAWKRFKERAAKAELTPSCALLTAFAQVLARWSTSQSFTLTVTLFQRPPVHPHMVRLVGDFTSLILLEIDLSRSESFVASARRIQSQLWADLDHSEFSGVSVLREIGRRSGRAGTPFAPVVFTSALVLDTSAAPGAAGSLPTQVVYAVSQTPQVWLDHQVYEQGGQLHMSWDAVDILFSPGMLDAMFTAYERQLRRLADDKGTWAASRRELLPRTQLVAREAANATGGPAHDGFLHGPFVEQVQRQPDAIAVVSGHRHLSYHEVYRRARIWAVRLRGMGARPNQPVAIAMERGWEHVVAAIAILEAGAAYLPIDPKLPARRRRSLLAQGAIEVVLTQPWLDDRLEWPASVRRLCVDSTVEGDGAAIADTSAAVSTNDLAYVIFTSGSTGVPKGVMIDHRAALNTILGVNDRFGMTARDRVLAVSSPSFDLAVYDIFGALAAGATIVLPEAARCRDPRHWASLVLRHGVTTWNSVPQLLEMLVTYVGGEAARLGQSLRLVLLSGDWIPVTLPDRIRALVPTLSVVSLGGATEAAIWSVAYPIATVCSDWTRIPYGRSLRNQLVHVLNEALEPCPEWVPGELFIGGASLARGYWRDPTGTAQRFVPHPLTGERLFRTGDRARYVPGGLLEFLGRHDRQVKLHGYRVELTEIEVTLTRHPGVKAAVVTVDDTGAARQLVAGVVLERATVKELVAFLRERLPSYMVPMRWTPLQALPLGPHGKVDRRALSPPHTSDVCETRLATEMEADVAEIWAAVLKRQAVRVNENFFELGGDSLLAVQFLSRTRERFGVEFPLESLLASPTVEGVAAALVMCGARNAVLRPTVAPEIEI
jgi:amino acid adenylation domain-containing protein